MDLSLAAGHSSLKISSKSVHNLLRYFAHRHTDIQTDHYENIISLAEVFIGKQKLAGHTQREWMDTIEDITELNQVEPDNNN